MPLLAGLLGGLVGGGVLGGMLGNRQRGGGSQPRNTQPEPSKDAPMAKEPEEQAGQTQAEEQPQKPQQPPTQQPPAQQMAQQIEQAQPQKPPQPLDGLLDPAPGAPEPQDTPGDNQPPPPQTVVNQAEEQTPVARPADEQFGEIPVAPLPDTLRNQLLDSGTNEQPFDFQDGNPSRQPSLPNQSYSADQGYRFVGPSGVDGALPPRRYR